MDYILLNLVFRRIKQCMNFYEAVEEDVASLLLKFYASNFY